MATTKNELAITAALYGICCVLSTLMTVNLYYSIYTNKKKKKLSDHLFYYAVYVISVISLTLGIYNGTLRCFLSYIFDSTNLLQNKSINVYGNIFHFVGSNLFYIIILLNIQNVFNNTIYSLNKTTFIMVIIVIILQFFSFLWYTLNEANSIQMFSEIPTFCMIVFGLLLNLLLIILYIIKLRNIILMHIDCNSMIDKIIKHTFLFATATLFNIIFYIVLICDKFTLYDGWFVLFPRCLHELSIIIALYFGFKFNEETYYKMCYKLHQLNRRCCIKDYNNNNNTPDDIVLTSELQNAQSNTFSANPDDKDIESSKLESIVRFIMNVAQTDKDELNSHKIRMKRILNNLHDTTSEEPSFDKLCRDDDDDDTSTGYKD